MDVWVEFKNASKWQAELLFRNFFPSTDEDNVVLEGDLEGIDLPSPPSPSTESSGFSSLFSLPSTPPTPVRSLGSFSSVPSTPDRASPSNKSRVAHMDESLKNQAYLPPPVDDEIAQHSAKPLDGATLAALAKAFADAIPDEEFSVAALQGYLLKNKSRPELAAHEAGAWVVSEREMKERLRKEREARELKEKLEREKRRKELVQKEKEKAEEKKKEDEEIARRVLEEKVRAERTRQEEAEKAADQPATLAEADKENDSPLGTMDGDAENKDDESNDDGSSTGSVTPPEGLVWVKLTPPST